jgi:hypothetical protein
MCAVVTLGAATGCGGLDYAWSTNHFESLLQSRSCGISRLTSSLPRSPYLRVRLGRSLRAHTRSARNFAISLRRPK